MGTVSARRSAVESRSLDQYLQEISSYPLIGREEEAALAARIRNGDEEALNSLVRANLRFVVSVAKRYQNQGVSLADLINEGNIGLMRAAQKFDGSKGIKFISYAVWWVRQAVLQALAEQSRIVRVPAKRAGDVHRIGRRSSALAQELGREPTLDEIAEELDVPREEISRTLCMVRAHLSLDAPLVPGEDGQLLDLLSDATTPAPDEDVYTRALEHSLDAALHTLSEREAQVIRLYYGLGETEPLTLEQIGERFGITRERVRQIRENGLIRLRHRSRARFLESYLA